MSAVSAIVHLHHLLADLSVRYQLRLHVDWEGALPEEARVHVSLLRAPTASISLRLLDLCGWHDDGVLDERLAVYLQVIEAGGEAQGIAA